MPTVPGGIASLAREYSPQAIRMLARIMNHSESDATRVQAAGMLLDRAWGKAPQAITGENGEGGIAIIIRHIIEDMRANPSDRALIDVTPTEKG